MVAWIEVVVVVVVVIAWVHALTCFYLVIDQNKMRMLCMQMTDSSSSSSEPDSSRFLGVDDAFEFAFDPALITLAPDPPPERSVIPFRPNPILIPPSDGFFVLATCTFHASIATKGTVIRTKRCPNNLRMIAKNNLGCADVSQGRFMDIMPSIMRNNKMAEDILKESMIACLSGVRSTCSAFEAAFAPESANPDQLAKMKSEFKLKCSKLEKIIKEVGINGLTELGTPKTQTEQLAILFNACEKGNALANSVYFGTMLAFDESLLHKTDRLNLERLMWQMNYIDYGVPKNKYMPTKRYYLNSDIGRVKPTNPLDVFIDEHLDCQLHLAVGVRLRGESYTVQLNVDLRALKASDPTTPNTITMDEVVKLLVSPTLTRRAVELVCEKYPKLNAPGNKDALIDLSEKEDTWQVALFDQGCSNIRMEGYPELLHTGPTVVVLSAKAHGSRPPRTQTIRLKKMKGYLPHRVSDESFTTTMRKHKRNENSSNSSSSDETIEPSTPKEDFTDADVEGSSGGSKRSQCKRRQCKRSQCKRRQCKRSQCKRHQTRHKRRHQCKRGRTPRVRR
jgi:hypothetical protein